MPDVASIIDSDLPTATTALVRAVASRFTRGAPAHLRQAALVAERRHHTWTTEELTDADPNCEHGGGIDGELRQLSAYEATTLGTGFDVVAIGREAAGHDADGRGDR